MANIASGIPNVEQLLSLPCSASFSKKGHFFRHLRLQEGE
jgi:hypothetical protein